MKVLLFLGAFAIALTIAGFDLAKPRTSPAAPRTAPIAPLPTTEHPRDHAMANPRPATAPAPIPAASSGEGATKIQVRVLPQRAADFATGGAYNLVAGENSLRLSPDALILPGVGQAVGVYVSPIREIRTPEQQMEEAFDTIHFDYDVVATGGAVAKFEFRTIAVDEEGEGWSEWREIPPEKRNAPINIERTAEKFQYRILLAQEPSGSAEIRDIKIVTLQDPAKAAQLFNYGTP